MAFYKITIQLRDKKLFSGIREINSNDIDAVWRYLEYHAKKEFADQVKEFKVVMLSKLDDEVQVYLKKSRRPPIINI